MDNVKTLSGLTRRGRVGSERGCGSPAQLP